MTEAALAEAPAPFMRPGGRPGLSSMPVAGLLVGEYPAPADVEWLRDHHGVTAVVNLQDESDLMAKNLDLPTLEAAYASAGVAFHHRPVRDGDVRAMTEGLSAILELLGALLDAGERVYLHCNAGFNRAPTVAIAYLRASRGLELQEAWVQVKQHRACAPYRRALEAFFAKEG